MFEDTESVTELDERSPDTPVHDPGPFLEGDMPREDGGLWDKFLAAHPTDRFSEAVYIVSDERDETVADDGPLEKAREYLSGLYFVTNLEPVFREDRDQRRPVRNEPVEFWDILDADFLVLLPGWEKARDAHTQVAFAYAAGIPAYPYHPEGPFIEFNGEPIAPNFALVRENCMSVITKVWIYGKNGGRRGE